MSLLGYPQAQASLTALVLNLIVSSASFYSYHRAGHHRWSLTAPFLAASVPAAFVGGLIPVSGRVFSLLLGVALLLASARLAGFGTGAERPPSKPPLWAALGVGGAIGAVSGMIGIVGGVFLIPLVVLLGWADAKVVSGTAAAFIFFNSASGLAARLLRGQAAMLPGTWSLVLVALAGGLLGGRAGATNWSTATVRRVLAAVLLLAAARLVTTGR